MSNKEIIDKIKKGINKGQKGYVAAYSLRDKDAPVNIHNWISTGSSTLDLAISNRREGGVPCGRITEIAGLEGSGKSLLGQHICAAVQQMGGIAIYFDTEEALSEEFCDAIGVNLEELIYVRLRSVEDIYKTIETVIVDVRSEYPDVPMCIVLDSLTSAIAEADLNRADYDTRGYATEKAIINSDSLKRLVGLISEQNIALVITSQLRQNMNAGPFGDKYRTSSGGLALQFFSSVRIRLSKVGKLKRTRNGNKEVIGMKVRARVVKNRCGPPERSVDFDVCFDSGIDNYNNWLKVMKDYNIVKRKSGNTYKFVDERNGKEWEFSVRKWAETVSNDEELRKAAYEAISEALIMKYRHISDVDIDEIEEDDGEDDE